MGPYNGYSAAERLGKFETMKRLIASGELPAPTGPCELCGDPAPLTGVEYHDEDYGAPPIWGKPAQYCLCKHCHVHKLHKRFVDEGQIPAAWQAFLAHVRRGGFARDLKIQAVKAEVDAYRNALRTGISPAQLATLNGGYKGKAGEEWFANLRTDKASLDDQAARVRPFDPQATFAPRKLRI